MPGYVAKALTRFWHPPLVKSQDQPYPRAKPIYGAKMQHATAEDTTPPLNKAGKKFIQEVCGVFLFLARRVNNGLLPTLSTLAPQQANPTEQTMALCKQFLDYMASQEEAVLTYKASTWFWQYTAMPPTYPNRRHAAAWADTCLWQGEMTYQQIMGPSSTFFK
jgi:hypothetical protein